MTTKFEFTAAARDALTVRERLKYGVNFKRIGVWTDGLGVSSEVEPGLKPAFELIEGKTYKITIEEVEAPYSLSEPQLTQAREEISQNLQKFAAACALRLKGGVAPHRATAGKSIWANEADIVGQTSHKVAGHDWLEADQIVFAEAMRMCADLIVGTYRT